MTNPYINTHVIYDILIPVKCHVNTILVTQVHVYLIRINSQFPSNQPNAIIYIRQRSTNQLIQQKPFKSQYLHN